MAEKKWLISIVDLPIVVFYDILSRLAPEEAFAFGTCSQKLFSAWLTKPYLVFRNAAFFPKNLDKHKRCLLRYCEENLYIQRLEIDVDEDELHNFHSSTFIDLCNCWIQTAAKNGVQKIGYVPNAARQDSYELPLEIFQAASLDDLWVRSCVLKLPERKDIRCQNLKQLVLHHSCLDELFFEKISSSCKLIENLEIIDCLGFDILKVIKLQKLKKFELELPICGRVEVQSPRLEYFHCHIEDSRDKLTELALHACPSLKILRLLGMKIVEEFFSNFGFNFPLLQDLAICSCLLPQRTRILSQSIKRLRLSWNEKLEEMEIDVPSMEFFKIDAQVSLEIIIAAVSKHCTGEINGETLSLLLEEQSSQSS